MSLYCKVALLLNWKICLAALLLLVSVNCYVYLNLQRVKSTRLKLAFAPLLVLATSPLLMLSIPFFFLLRQSAGLLLWCRHGWAYGGLVDGRDAVYNYEKDNPLHVLVMVEYDAESRPDFFASCKEKIVGTLERRRRGNCKFFGVVRTFMGYSYVLRNHLKIEDCIHRLSFERPISRDGLLAAIADYSTVPLPYDKEALWEVYIGTQPVNWGHRRAFPVLIRVSHTFADGAHLLKGLVELFSDDGSQPVPCGAHIQHLDEGAVFHWDSSSTYLLRFRSVAQQLVAMLLAPSVSLLNATLMSGGDHPLHGPPPSYRKLFFLRNEPEPRYAARIRSIKRRFDRCAFEDVVLAAIGASFCDFFRKHTPQEVPEYIMVEVPAVPVAIIGPQRGKPGEILCRNRLTISVRKIPMRFDVSKPGPLLELFDYVRRQGDVIRRSCEPAVNYFNLSVLCHLLPGTLMGPFADVVHRCTALVTNLPGPQSVTVLDGCRVLDIVPWAANRGRTGIGFVIFTYEDRLQLSMVVDRDIVGDRHEAEGLLDGVFKYLDKMYDGCKARGKLPAA